MFCLEEIYLLLKDTSKLKVVGWQKIYHMNSNQRKVGVFLVILDKIDFETKSLKVGHLIMIKSQCTKNM